MYVIVLSLTGR